VCTATVSLADSGKGQAKQYQAREGLLCPRTNLAGVGTEERPVGVKHRQIWVYFPVTIYMSSPMTNKRETLIESGHPPTQESHLVFTSGNFDMDNLPRWGAAITGSRRGRSVPVLF